MDCKLRNMQDVGKTKIVFKIGLNNHRKCIKKSSAILTCRHFQQQSYVFNEYAKFFTIVNTSSPKDDLCQQLVQRENFWIEKLKTLVPY